MEQELRFGLDLGRLALLKKMGRLWATFEAEIFMFSWAKKFEKIVASALKSGIK